MWSSFVNNSSAEWVTLSFFVSLFVVPLGEPVFNNSLVFFHKSLRATGGRAVQPSNTNQAHKLRNASVQAVSGILERLNC